MPSTYKSPFATSFKSAIKRGTPCSVAVNNIAKRTKKSPTVVFNSLWKAGLCHRQKFNGQWVYWPSFTCKKSASNAKSCQADMWQCFVDWCVCSGFCTPEQLKNNCGSQQEFMTYCRKFWNKQYNTGTKTTTKRRTGTKSRTTSYSWTGTRKYRRAA